MGDDMEIIKTMGGTLSYSPGNHRYQWHDADGNGGKVDLSVSAVASAYAVPFGAASGWAAKIIKEELLKSDVEIPTAGDDGRLDWVKEICRAPWRETKRAADIGTQVHRFIEDLAHGLEPDLSDDEDVAKCQRGLGEWFRRNVAEVLHIERRLYSPRWRIAGTCDMIARLQGIPGQRGPVHILDWKGVTDLSASLKNGHIGQLTAYRSMVEEAGEQIDGCTLVRFSRATGEVEADTLKNHPENLAAFEAALRLARYKPQVDIL
jgi:hypothetical protein